MTEPIITVFMSSNEQGSGRDVSLMKEIDRHQDRWRFAFANIDLDLLFVLGKREIRWELKMPADLLQSWQSGHLAAQRMQAASYDGPACIGVLGSNMDVLDHIPKVTKQSGFLGTRERAGFESAIERWEAACFASGFPVHYFSGGLDNSMRRICRWSRNYLLGETELPLPKAESYQMYCLKGLPGVGEVTAQDMLTAGFRVDLLMTGAPLTAVKGIGPKKAAKILEAVR